MYYVQIIEFVEIVDKLLDACLARCNEVQAVAHQRIVANLDIHVIPSSQVAHYVYQRYLVEIEVAVFPLYVALGINRCHFYILILAVFSILAWLQHHFLALGIYSYRTLDKRNVDIRMRISLEVELGAQYLCIKVACLYDKGAVLVLANLEVSLADKLDGSFVARKSCGKRYLAVGIELYDGSVRQHQLIVFASWRRDSLHLRLARSSLNP